MEEINLYTPIKGGAESVFNKSTKMNADEEPHLDEEHEVAMHMDHYHSSEKNDGYKVHSFYGLPS